MWASTAVTRPSLTATDTTPHAPHASASPARGHFAGVTTRPARYAVSVANGIPRTSRAVIMTDAGERPSWTYGKRSATQVSAARMARWGPESVPVPRPAPCQESRKACQSPAASLERGRSSAPASPAPPASNRPERRESRKPHRDTTVAARTARNPGLVAMRCGMEAGSVVSASASSATGPGSTRSGSTPGADLVGRSGVSASWTRSTVCRAACPGVTNNVWRSRLRSRALPRKRHRAAAPLTGWASAPRSHTSSQAWAGRLRTSSTRAEPMAARTIQSARNGAASSEQRVRATCRAPRR